MLCEHVYNGDQFFWETVEFKGSKYILPQPMPSVSCLKEFNTQRCIFVLLVIPSAMGQHMYWKCTYFLYLGKYWVFLSTFLRVFEVLYHSLWERKRHSRQLIKYHYWTEPTENNIFVRTLYLSGTEPTQSKLDTIAPNLAWMILKGNIWMYQILYQGLTVFFDLFDTFNQKHRTYYNQN